MPKTSTWMLKLKNILQKVLWFSCLRSIKLVLLNTNLNFVALFNISIMLEFCVIIYYLGPRQSYGDPRENPDARLY